MKTFLVLTTTFVIFLLANVKLSAQEVVNVDGNSPNGTVNSAPSFICGSSLLINHVAGTVAPVAKTVTYGTVTNIPGETSKCWITSNLGADHQAAAANDATEASAGWYWQFNLRQGYKVDGNGRIPGSVWISQISQNSEWTPTNDPCTNELGSGWRLPTYNEWYNVDANTGGHWDTWNDPWASDLKIHAAGYLEYVYGGLLYRGAQGFYWSSTQTALNGAWQFHFTPTFCGMVQTIKSSAQVVRCLRDAVTASIPSVTTTPVSDIAQTTATGGGNVTYDGGATVTERGVCWSTATDPTINGFHSTDGSGTGTFLSNLTGLVANTLYYVRAYATNDAGTAYGNPLTFHTLSETGQPCSGIPTVAYGGMNYNTVQIGAQCWFKENLNIGTKVNGSENQTNNSILEKYCYNDDESSCNIYGGLYQWNEMMQYVTTEGVQGICPAGWHLPTDTEFSTLSTYLGGEPVAGGKMKETGYTHWSSPNTDATNSSGYTALPGGYRYLFGYLKLANAAYFWSSSQAGDSYAWYRYLNNYEGWMNKDGNNETLGFSVRCLKDQTVPATQTIQQVSIPNGQNLCYSATQTITVAGSGTAFTVENGGSATMVAGQNIRYLPGTTVQSGGYLWGHIAPDGPYCPAPAMPDVKSTANDFSQIAFEPAFFKLYPNPTTGSFTLEFKGEIPVDQIMVEINGLHGEKVFTGILKGERNLEFSLSNYPVGVYFVRVISGNISETGKIIKQ